MVGLVIMAVMAFTVLIVMGALATALSLVFLPFRILGWAIKGLGMLLMLPILLVVGCLGFLVFGFGVVLFLVPVLPFALLAFVAWRLFRRPRSATASG